MVADGLYLRAEYIDMNACARYISSLPLTVQYTIFVFTIIYFYDTYSLYVVQHTFFRDDLTP